MTTGRQQTRMNIDLFANKYIGNEPFLCRTSNLSAEGAFLLKLIEPTRELMGESIGIEFTLPGNEEIIWINAEVLREEKQNGISGLAIRFVAIAEKHRQMITHFINETGGWVCH